MKKRKIKEASPNLWENCVKELQDLFSETELKAWIYPLQADDTEESLFLFAPNDFVVDRVKQHFLEEICRLVKEISSNNKKQVVVTRGSKKKKKDGDKKNIPEETPGHEERAHEGERVSFKYGGALNASFTFSSFVKGKSNAFAFATAFQVAQNPGGGHNPLLIYGGVGLGKTHLMHAIGHAAQKANSQHKVLYLHSERFVANMIKALQTNTIERFQRYYRSVDFLLIDDVQFFAGKERSQEEFFHTFNTLLEEKKQIVLTCDRYPKEIGGLKERLRSRFGWGLTVAIEPPDLETRVAILMSKAELARVQLPTEAAFFIAKCACSNVRELEGALKQVVANAGFTGRPITTGLVKEVLKDLITLQEKLVTVENIQRVVAEYYRIKLSEMLSKRRCRSVTRPRQMAMMLSKELTDRSLPEIGSAFGGRDHTTVLHAYRKIKELLGFSSDIQEDYSNLLRLLTA